MFKPIGIALILSTATIMVALHSRADSDAPTRTFVLTAVKSIHAAPIQWIRLRESTTGKQITIYPAQHPEFALLEVPPGRYNVSAIQSPTWAIKYGNKEFKLFEVLPGAITYIGDVTLGDGGAYTHELSEETIVKAYKANEGLFKALPTMVASPGIKPQRIDVDALVRQSVLGSSPTIAAPD